MVGPRVANLEMLELLGLGGAAEVYRALDRSRGCEVAVKVLSERAEPEMVARFVREARALERLRHPHIVALYDAGEESGQRYIVMELVRGGSLRERLQGERMPWRDACHIAQQVALALGSAHEQGIVHRDIKPGNILFDEDGSAKLTDFGLAHLTDVSAMTRTGTVMGTVLYLSPEQALGRAVDARSDLYSLGAVLYEMLAGKPPFVGDSAVAVIYKHLNEEPQSLAAAGVDVPANVERIVMRLLAKDHDRRYASADELADALTDAMDSGSHGESRGSTGATELEVSSADVRVGDAALSPLPLAGRAEERQALVDALDDAVAGSGTVVLLAGEAGIGKTRLARELEAVARQKNVLALWGACLYSDAPDPYAPIAEIVDAFGAGRGKSTTWAVLGELEKDVEAALGAARQVLGLEPDGPGIPDWWREAAPLDAQMQLFQTMARFLGTIARQRPVLVVLDDLQWASMATLQLLHHLARATRGQRVMLLGLYRTDEPLAGDQGEATPLAEVLRRMSRERLYREIRLERLKEADLELLVGSALHAEGLEPEFARVLYRESEGNPFYLLETLRLLQHQGDLERVGDHWEMVALLENLQIPRSIVDLVERRLARIAPDERELLEWAAVAGPRLDASLLADLTGERRLSVLRLLRTLQDEHALLVSSPAGFGFAHSKVGEVIYESVPAPLLREMHLMVGELLEERYAAGDAVSVYDLARHFYEAGDAVRGHQYALQAADAAEAALAPGEAAAHLGRALELAEALLSDAVMPEQELETRQRYAGLLATLGQQERASNAYAQALAQARALGDVRSEGAILLEQGALRGRAGAWAEASVLIDDALQLGVHHGLALTQVDALQRRGYFAFEQGNWEEAVDLLRKALERAAAYDLPLHKARILGNLGIVEHARGRPEVAIELFRDSVATFSTEGMPLDVVRGLSNMGFCFQAMERYDEAIAIYEEALERLEQVGDVREEGLAHLHMAESCEALGNVTEAREHCAKASRRFSLIGFEQGIADVDRVYARIATRQNRWEVAERYLRHAIAVYDDHGDQLNLAETHGELAALLERVGERVQAANELERSKILYASLHGCKDSLADTSPGG
jgi:eukaryotic-like serine/threonine-protein kinase